MPLVSELAQWRPPAAEDDFIHNFLLGKFARNLDRVVWKGFGGFDVSNGPVWLIKGPQTRGESSFRLSHSSRVSFRETPGDDSNNRDTQPSLFGASFDPFTVGCCT